jgi:CHAD domain-containing protein
MSGCNVPAMSTDPTKDVTAYPEHDKLGPLGTRASLLEGGGDLRAAIVAEFREGVDKARSAATEVRTDAATAVHDYRKGLRRARAVLALVEAALPRGERRAIREVLRTARRAVSAARDHVVAPEALARISLSDDERTTADAVLVAAREAAPPSDEVARLLADGAARATAQADALEAVLPPALEWDTVADGIAATYREARGHLRKARKSKRAFHAWRRRSKELTYQLELVARHAGERTAALRGEYEAVADTLGGAVDLIMLRELVTTHGANQPPEKIEALLATLDDQLADATRAARKAGKPLFARSGRKFARRVEKRAKKDLAPSRGTGSGGGNGAPANGAPTSGASTGGASGHDASA